MRVEHLNPEHDDELVAFLDDLGGRLGGERVLGYHYPENRRMLLASLPTATEACYLAARSPAGQLLGVLPGLIGRSGDLCCYNSLPFFGPNVGVLADLEDTSAYQRMADLLVGAAVETARSMGAVTACFYSSFNPAGANIPLPHFESFGDPVQIERFTQYVALSESSLRWTANVRNHLRKATRSGLRVATGFDSVNVDELYAVYERNCLDRGVPVKPASCIHYLARHGGNRLAAYSAYLDDEFVAALLVFLGPRTASYYLPCCKDKYRSLQANSLLIDTACRELHQRGIRYWNWEGSPGRESAVYHFKNKWGSSESPYQISAVLLGDLELLRHVGPAQLSARLPFFFVYPFDRL